MERTERKTKEKADKLVDKIAGVNIRDVDDRNLEMKDYSGRSQIVER